MASRIFDGKGRFLQSYGIPRSNIDLDAASRLLLLITHLFYRMSRQ